MGDLKRGYDDEWRISQSQTIIVPLNIDDLEVFKFDVLPKPIGEGNVHCPRCGLPAFKNGSTLKYRNGEKRVQKYRCPNGHSFNEKYLVRSYI